MHSANIPETSLGNIRLEFLDGIRGLAALAVVFCHVANAIILSFNHARVHITFFIKAFVYFLHLIAYFGHVSVVVFIVLSGYSLMLPVARSADAKLKGGWKNYIFRRAWRILPPYYAALAICIILWWPLRHDQRLSNPSLLTSWVFPIFEPKILLSHLLLLHNINTMWLFRIDPPMWSIATEWQIYFALPAMLLPIYRCLGVRAMLLTALIGSMVIHRMQTHLDPACPWFLWLFALGTAGALLNWDPRLQQYRSFPWPAFVTGICMPLLILGLRKYGPGFLIIMKGDLVIGPLIIMGIVACVQYPKRFRFLLRFLEASVTTHLGRFSYSLYLIHFPVVALADFVFLSILHLSFVGFTLMMLIVIPPLCLAIAYLFYLAIEKPTLAYRARALKA